MLSAAQLPDFVGSSKEDAIKWWDQMLDLGLNFHPDDDLTGIVSDTGECSLDDAACASLATTCLSMHDTLGDHFYEAGAAALMGRLGYVENPAGVEGNTADFWVHAARLN